MTPKSSTTITGWTSLGTEIPIFWPTNAARRIEIRYAIVTVARVSNDAPREREVQRDGQRDEDHGAQLDQRQLVADDLGLRVTGHQRAGDADEGARRGALEPSDGALGGGSAFAGADVGRVEQVAHGGGVTLARERQQPAGVDDR